MKPSTQAYTLIEVLVAAAILMIAAAASGALGLAMLTQEEINARVARCINLHEQAVRLYQLGLDPSAVTAILPHDPSVESLVFVNESVEISGLGTVETATSTLVYHPLPHDQAWAPLTWTGGPDSDSTTRTHRISAVRPSIR